MLNFNKNMNSRTILFLNTLLLMIVFSLSSHSQPSSIPVWRAIYEFSHVEDSTQADKPFKEEYYLYFNMENALYIREIEEHAEFSRFIQQGRKAEEFKFESIYAKVAFLYQSISEQKLVDTKRIATQMFQVQESLPELNWEIINEFKSIEGYQAQKAITHFRGRTYEVWFTPEIPISFGPWKLQGLPGLILEAQDTKNHLIFSFKGVESSDKSFQMGYDTNIKQVSYKDYERVYKGFRDNPEAYIRSITSPGTQVFIGSGSSSSSTSRNSSTRPIQYNNPMELTFPL